MRNLFKSLIIVVAVSRLAVAQPYYTPMRGAFGLDFRGIAPQGSVGAEAAFGYSTRTFLAVHTGLGIVIKRGFGSAAISGDLTYCVVLNPYRRRSCVPEPGNYLIETYFEAGAGGFFVDRYDNSRYTGLYRQRLFTPSGIVGFRVHRVTPRWIYMLKLRYTPSFVSSDLTYDAGVGISVGWR